LSILNTLNLERNVVEHEYRVPSRARVQEVIDVARLWLLATGRLTEYVAYESLAGWRADQTLGLVQLDPAQGMLSFFKVTGPIGSFEHHGQHYPMLEPIRMVGGGLAPDIEIEPSPLWSELLSYQNRATWRPLLRPVVALNAARYGVERAVVRHGVIEVSMRITLPLAQQERISEFIARDKFAKGPVTLNYADFVFGFASGQETSSEGSANIHAS
jgi:hypothetical protein